MGRKTKLEQAVEDKAADLNEAQRELVLSQLRDFNRNRARIAKIDDGLAAMDMQPVSGSDGARTHLARKTALVAERGKLAEANNAIYGNIFDQLGD